MNSHRPTLRPFEKISMRDYTNARERRVPRTELVSSEVVRLYLRYFESRGLEPGPYRGDAYIEEAKHRALTSLLVVTFKLQKNTTVPMGLVLDGSNLAVSVNEAQTNLVEIGFIAVEGIGSEFDELLDSKELDLAH